MEKKKKKKSRKRNAALSAYILSSGLTQQILGCSWVAVCRSLNNPPPVLPHIHRFGEVEDFGCPVLTALCELFYSLKQMTGIKYGWNFESP